MDLLEAINRRHSVRAYEDRPLSEEHAATIQRAIEICNKASGLHMQLVTDDPEAFSGLMAKVMRFSGVHSYIAMVGARSDKLDETCGYYGEKIVLLAQQLGLNTCWVGMNSRMCRDDVQINTGEKLLLVIAIGYGVDQGKKHKGKSMSDVSGESDVSRSVPQWYKDGVNAALLAPTAINQQKFAFEREGNRVSVSAGMGPFSKVDLGIVKCHFEIGAGKDNFEWM